MDILEFFINKLKVYLLVLLDDFSRFILGFRLFAQTSIDEVIGLVQEAIDRYGKMEEMLTDRGFVFYSWKGANRFERYLEVERIEHTQASAHHPQTLGKIEALNGHLRTELLDRQHFCGVEQAQGAVGQWVFQYNYERTHQGLGGLFVPADRFHGLTDLVVASLAAGRDMDTGRWYAARAVERSMINLTVDSQGRVTFYLLGQPLVLGPARPDEKEARWREAECGGSGHADSSPTDSQGKELPKDIDVKAICEAGGDLAQDRVPVGGRFNELPSAKRIPTVEELRRLKAEHEDLKKRYRSAGDRKRRPPTGLGDP